MIEGDKHIRATPLHPKIGGKLDGIDLRENISDEVREEIHEHWMRFMVLIFPNQADRGTHVNISGGGIAMHSKNKVEAKNFLEFLTTKTAQDLYAAVNFEYPVNSNVPLSEELKSWGVFIEDRMPISRVAELAPEAQRVIDRAGW